MVTTPKPGTVPAKKGSPMAPTALKLNPAALVAEDVPATDFTVTRPRETTVDFGPFLVWLKESKDTGTGKAVAVAKDTAPAYTSLIRRAAASLGYGVTVKTSETVQANGNVTVKFMAKDKRATDENKPRRPVRKDKWTDAEYAKATHEWINSTDPKVGISAYLTENGMADKIEGATAKAKADLVELRAKIKAAAAAAKAS